VGSVSFGFFGHVLESAVQVRVLAWQRLFKFTHPTEQFLSLCLEQVLHRRDLALAQLLEGILLRFYCVNPTWHLKLELTIQVSQLVTIILDKKPLNTHRLPTDTYLKVFAKLAHVALLLILLDLQTLHVVILRTLVLVRFEVNWCLRLVDLVAQVLDRELAIFKRLSQVVNFLRLLLVVLVEFPLERE